MLKLNSLSVTKPEEMEIQHPGYKKKSFPNGMSSYWIRFKLFPPDQIFFSYPKTLVINFDKELDKLNNENLSVLNEWKVSKLSYSNNLEKMCEELNFFEVLYDEDGELITSLFRVKYLIDVDTVSFTLKNFDSFIDFCYKTIFTQSLKEKISRMVEENYCDDIEAENDRNMKNPEMMTIMQRKKKSLEFRNVHVKNILEISFGLKILSFIINHFCVMRGIAVQKNLNLFYKIYIPMFSEFEHDFNIYHKIFSYIESKVNSAYNFNKTIFEQQEIEG